MLDTSKIDFSKMPKHVAVIMDGNGRWAKQRGKLRIFGHTNAITSVRDTVEIAAELGVKVLTLYAFSTENWNRPQDEVSSLMSLMVSTLGGEVDRLHKNQIKLVTIGNTDALPDNVKKKLEAAKELTKNNTHMTLNIALSYSARWEIVKATKQIALQVKEGKLDPEDINDDVFAANLETAGMPDPELLIRTSGEERISNFLLWQLSYAELYFTEILWPDFRKQNFIDAIINYQGRERRFGKTSEQLTK